jgi:uncharacterized protein (DUF58 family)
MLPRELIKTVRRLEITTRRAVNDRLAGQYHSVFKGRGMAFDEVRLYQPGDDVRAIDWNVSARMSETHVKVFSEERELTVVLLVDASASVAFGTRAKSKAEIAAELTALLAFSAVTNNDRVGLVLFTDRVERFVPPKRGRKHVMRIVSQILAHRTESPKTDLAVPFTFLRRAVHRSAIAFAVSDFLGPLSSYGVPLMLASRRHDVVPLVLSDPMETELPNVGLMRVQDPETGQLGYVDTSDADVRVRYRHAHQGLAQERRKHFSRLGLDHLELGVEGDYVKPLLSFFRARERRRRA